MTEEAKIIDIKKRLIQRGVNEKDANIIAHEFHAQFIHPLKAKIAKKVAEIHRLKHGEKD